MFELFLPWFLTTCISGILGNRTDAKFVSITQNILEQVQLGKIVNHDMQKALNRSFLLSLLSICDSCLNELKHESHLQKGNFKLSGQLHWLETKKLSLEDELKAVEKMEYREPTNEVLDKIKFLLIQGDPTSEAFQKIKTELTKEAEIGNKKAPECYIKSVEENILSQMYNHLAYEIKSNQAISNILETQLLIQLGIKIDTVLASVPSVVQNLNFIPSMAYQVDTVAHQVGIMVQAMPQMLERISSEKNTNAPCRIFQVPPLTEDFVEIPKKEEIKNYLLNSNKSRRILSITAIQGLGGIGKTTLATVLGHDEDVQNYFSDGILWAPLGQEPDKLSWLNNWIQALGDYQTIHTTTETASIHLRSLLCEKRILLVIDDAWDSSDVKPFLVGGSNCQTIITTRKAYIADDLSAESYPLNVMTEEQALELFRNVLKDCWDENEKENALKVAKDVGYLPLALNLAAKRRRGGYSWAKLHEALEEEIARLGVLEIPRIFGKGEEGLEASLNLSLKALRSCNENVWKNFIWLGVLPEDVKINKKMVSTLWDIDTGEAGEILEGLWGEGLLIQGSTINLRDEKLETYRMHDLFHDIALYYLTSSLDTKKATSLPGLGVKLKEAHTFLLNRYQLQTQKKGLWHTLKDDAYIHSYLTWHLEKAGKIEDIHSLLGEENENGKNGWYEALESLGLNAVFIEDVIRAWNLSEKESEYQVERGSKVSSIGLEIRYALIYTSINSFSANIPLKLLVALLETKKWTEAKVFMYAQKEPDLYKRVIKLIYIYKKTKNGFFKKEEVIEKAFNTALKIKNSYTRAQALLTIVPYLEDQKKEEVIKEVLDAASKIENSDYRVFLAIVPYLDDQKKGKMMEKALEAATKIKDNEDRVKALSFIIPYLDGQKEEMIKEALDAAIEIQYDTHSLILALSYIIPYLDNQKKEKVVERALDAIFKMRDDGSFTTGALSSIVPYLDGQNKEKVIEKALNEARNCVWALLPIIPDLDGQKKEEVIDKTLDAISEIIEDDGDYSRAKAFLSIIPYLDGQKKEDVIERAFNAISEIRDDDGDYPRVETFSAVIPYLNGQKKETMMEKALNEASKIKDESSRAKALSSIVPYLDSPKKEKLIEKTLESTSNIHSDNARSEALSSIAPYLDGVRNEEIKEKAFDAASKIKDDSIRAEALLTIVPYLDGQKKEEVTERALDAALNIENDYKRTEALLTIVPYLDGQKKEDVIEKALDVASKITYDRREPEELLHIVSRLDSQKKEKLMEKILDTSLKIQDDEKRAEALLSIVPYLDGQKTDQVMEKALDAASKIKDNCYMKAELLSSIVPYLDGQKTDQVMEKALEAASKIKDHFTKVLALSVIAPNLDGQKKEELIEEALDVIPKITYNYSDYEKLDALSSIVPYLGGQKNERLIEKAFDAASKIEYNDERAEALSIIVPYLDGSKKEEMIEKVLDEISNITDDDSDNAKAEALSIIVPYLDGQKKEKLMEKALDAATKIKDDYEREKALSSIVPYLDGQKKEEMIEKVLDVASKIEKDNARAKALSTIVPYLDRQKKEEVMEKALDAASKIENENARLDALSTIIPYLDGQKKEEVMENALDAASKIKDDNERANALNNMLSYLRMLPLNNLYFWWIKTVKIFREFTRSSLLVDITILIQVINDLGNHETPFEISQAITDVSRWWP